jgi:hypothetical protein
VGSEEGYIKFGCEIEPADPDIPDLLYQALNGWRNQLRELRLIGMNEQGIGFGNLSVRLPGTSRFYITGTATGEFKHAGRQHYTLVTGYSFSGNWVTCRGPLRASSESLSHAAIYEADAQMQSVIHVHHKKMWEHGISHLPVTDPACSFGTPDIAINIKALLQDFSVRKGGVLIMGGHPEGILFFGRSPDEAGNSVLKLFKSVSPYEDPMVH